ncbi:MAG: hypothetical protein GX433_07630 [Deltaproteobacteria bacterium]|jgi:hypothetical protein|uniref:ATP-binding protein n=1 Tax=Desulforhabdus amnigena TaxID=40218 RepID=A0A9W6FUS9_9BACT|nr:hypothetical protein [Desulforhabdus amnigena]NLJ27867.1 hypothetical protein [Deltaproteobacteria bacterium]GLI35253.1 hypothetical protein DAMNIGENAA_26860 [Desulforhabdus amnigena]
MDCYRGRSSISHDLYTDGEQFFSQGTYPTEGLRLVLTDVFGRIAGRGSPAIHRLETAFGGGKTHILIALAHLGFRGNELASVADGILDPALLPAPGEVSVVGVAGDEIPVHKPRGTRLVPYTLWGEIAYQIGGESLYRSVEQEAASYAAPSMEMLSATARKTVSGGTGTFHIEHDVSAPEHVADNKNQPVLAMITLDAREIDPETFITTVGPNRPCIRQNHVFLPVPNTVHVKGEIWNEERVRRAVETLNRLQDLARWVIAMRRLKEKPEDYGVHPSKLNDADFLARQKERELALQTALAQTYDGVWYPSASGQIVYKDIKTSGGEGGFSILEELRRVLLSEGELISAERVQTREMLQALSALFFESSQTPTVASRRSRGAAADESGYHAPLVRSGSKLRIARPEERNEKRLRQPQTDWDLLQGLIQEHRRGGAPVAHRYLEQHGGGNPQRVINLLEVWAAEVPEEKLRKEAETIRYDLASRQGYRR